MVKQKILLINVTKQAKQDKYKFDTMFLLLYFTIIYDFGLFFSGKTKKMRVSLIFLETLMYANKFFLKNIVLVIVSKIFATKKNTA